MKIKALSCCVIAVSISLLFASQVKGGESEPESKTANGGEGGNGGGSKEPEVEEPEPEHDDNANTVDKDINDNSTKHAHSKNLSTVGEVEPIEIGNLYPCAHHLKGTVYAENEREILIRDFEYGGRGKAVWFHGQFKGSEGISGEENTYMTLPFPNASCDRLHPEKEYKDEEIRLVLPLSIKNFSAISLFCYKSCHNYGHVNIPEDLEVPEAPKDLMHTAGCHTSSGYLGLVYDTCYRMDTKNTDFHLDCVSGSISRTPLPLIFIVLLTGRALISGKVFQFTLMILQ